jgi:hypothetical protein
MLIPGMNAMIDEMKSLSLVLAKKTWVRSGSSCLNALSAMEPGIINSGGLGYFRLSAFMRKR